MANNFVEEMQEWHAEIGRMILCFGDIEYSVYLILNKCGDTDYYPEYKNEDFMCRARKCIKIIKSLDRSPEETGQLIQLLKDSLALIQTRNLIAHNPLHPVIEGEKTISLKVISTKKSESKITLESLVEAANESARICSEMYRITNAISRSNT